MAKTFVGDKPLAGYLEIRRIDLISPRLIGTEVFVREYLRIQKCACRSAAQVD
jgi:hypothetical protein